MTQSKMESRSRSPYSLTSTTKLPKMPAHFKHCSMQLGPSLVQEPSLACPAQYQCERPGLGLWALLPLLPLDTWL